MPPGYMYQSPYLAATAPGSLVPLPSTQLSHAAAVAAATSQFYEYNAAAVAAAAAAPYTGQYTTNGFDAYTPYTGAAGKYTHIYPHEIKTRQNGFQTQSNSFLPTRNQKLFTCSKNLVNAVILNMCCVSIWVFFSFF